MNDPLSMWLNSVSGPLPSPEVSWSLRHNPLVTKLICLVSPAPSLCHLISTTIDIMSWPDLSREVKFLTTKWSTSNSNQTLIFIWPRLLLYIASFNHNVSSMLVGLPKSQTLTHAQPFCECVPFTLSTLWEAKLFFWQFKW